ncbi:MAG: type III pantothenate kinase [Gammaproteobacteria bacterium]|nr:type III pantothenate kinase [Gammaproteobacteria bacterium]
MTVVIDAGNSRIKWARCRNGKLERSEHAAWNDADLWQRLADAVAGCERVVAANVAGPDKAEQIAAVVAAAGAELEWVVARSEAYGLTSAYADAGSLGADRWCALIGARRDADGDVCVIGAGTAVTFDAVTAEGRHLGGLILPGERLMLDALASNTKLIGRYDPVADWSEVEELLGRSTQQAVTHGAALAVGAALDRAIEFVAATLGRRPAVVVGGGAAASIAAKLASTAAVRADLVLEGLAFIADETS